MNIMAVDNDGKYNYSPVGGLSSGYTAAGTALGGMVGVNYHSMVLNGFTDTKVSFDTNAAMKVVNDLPFDGSGEGSFQWTMGPAAPISIGGLVGSSDDRYGIATCLANSYSLSQVNIEAATENDHYTVPFGMALYSAPSYGLNVGGIAGFLADASVNTYFGGKITWNDQTVSTDLNFDLNKTWTESDGSTTSLYGYGNASIISSDSGHQGLQISTAAQIQHSSADDTKSGIVANQSSGSGITIGQLFGVAINQQAHNGDGAPSDYFTIDNNFYRPYADGTYFDVGALSRSGVNPPNPDGTTPGPVNTEAFSSSADLLSDLQSGNHFVQEVAINHTSTYSNDPAVVQEATNYTLSRIQGWQLNPQNGLPMLAFQANPYLPAAFCKPIIIPSPPNTGRRK
jgi:hypothetical protein